MLWAGGLRRASERARVPLTPFDSKGKRRPHFKMTAGVSSTKKRLERWSSFMDHEISSGFMFYVNFSLPEREAQLPPWPPLWPDKAKQRIERQWAEYELRCHKAKLVDDDRVPYLSNVTGTEIFAEAFGCRVHRPDDNNPFALPLIHTAAEAEGLKIPELSTSSLAYLFEIGDELYRRGGPGAVMQLVDVQSPMDIVALIWDKSDLFIAMVKDPNAVQALAEKVRKLVVAFFDEWFGRYGTTFVAHCPDYVMQHGLSMSVDEVGAISEDMFRQFFRDELIALSDHFGGLGIHCCADARHQWGNFRNIPGLRLMNHFPPPKREDSEYILDSLRFYGAKIAQMPCGWSPDGAPESWPSQFPKGTRIVFGVDAEDTGRAAAIAERLQEVREAGRSGAGSSRQPDNRTGRMQSIPIPAVRQRGRDARSASLGPRV